MINLNDLMLNSFATNTSWVKIASKKLFTAFGTKHSLVLFGQFNNKDFKYFNISDSTINRLKAIPVDEINGNKLISLSEKQSHGIVYFNNGIHFMYAITSNGVYIMSSCKKTKKQVEDVNFYLRECVDGFLYYDFYSGGNEQYINNLYDALHNPDHGLNMEKSLHPSLRALKKELEAGQSGLRDMYLNDFTIKYNNLKLCLQAFLFIHFAKIIDTTLISVENGHKSLLDRIKKRPSIESKVIRVDTFYDENMKVINPFPVKGHFRNQPIGSGRKEQKLIYIDGFMKTGYNRDATKTKIGLTSTIHQTP